ncbi:putative transporter [Lachnellula willkommii]|uniref:Putative transporter n=1 Tax=Lachnellula willkommii TaxID=215461 RepID=A0A559MF87_9HELO|nr:putative transporter [Lachnellula willkommii]
MGLKPVDGDKISSHVNGTSSVATPDSLHSDVAVDRIAFLSSFSPEEDKAIRRKVDWRFLWLIGMMYIIKNIDYTNAASVKVLQVGKPSNILKQLKMSADDYNWVQSIYFISYIVFEVPSNLLLKKMSPRNWQFRIILSWGIVLACHAAVKNKKGSLLAYGISYMDGLCGMSAWQWVYLLEGITTILFAIVVFFVLPDYPKSPRSNKWLTPREQEYLELRLSENAPKTEDAAFNTAEILESLRNPRTYAFMLSQILTNLGGYGLSWQLPTVTTSLGFAGLPRNQLLNIPPAAASVLAIIFAGWFQKRAYTTRPAFIMFICAGALVFFIVLASTRDKYAVYIACVFGTMFYSVYFIPFWAWRSSTLAGTTGTAFTLAFQSCVGQVGGVIGPQLFRSKYAHNGYKVPFAICAAAIGAGWLASAWTWWLTRNVEWDVRRIRRLRIKSEKEGKVFADDDVKVFEERRFYGKTLEN